MRNRHQKGRKRLQRLSHFAGRGVFFCDSKRDQEKRPVVYFTGTLRTQSVDFDKLKYSEIGKIIQRDNIDPLPLLFGRDQRVPEDCDTTILTN